MIILLMGVAGSGKTTIGQKLAATLGWSFFDADDFHPPENIARMSAGLPLDDSHRAPWLTAIHAKMLACLKHSENAVFTCSALREKYRATLLAGPVDARLVYLKGSRELLHERLSARTGHFMAPNMLESQLDTLEEPTDALTVSIAGSPSKIVAEIQRSLGL